MEYHAREQFRVIKTVKACLDESDEIDFPQYIKLTQCLGAGMLTRLRLTPDKGIEGRLSHLYALCECALMEKPLFDDQVLVSFEGLNPAFSFDCDIILESENVTYLIDFTSSNEYSVITEKIKILDAKRFDPSLNGRRIETIVHRYSPKHFTADFKYVVDLTPSTNPEYYTMAILDIMAKRSLNTNQKFIDNCTRVLDYAHERIASSLAVPKNYSTIDLPQNKIDQAVMSAQSNRVSDICPLFADVTKKQYRPFLDAVRGTTSQFFDKREHFIHREADICSSEATFESILSDLKDDLLAKAIYQAEVYPSKFACVKPSGEFDYLDKPTLSRTNNKMLAYDSGYSIAAKKLKGHYFTIYFSYEAMDKQLRRIITSEVFLDTRVPRGTKASMEELINTINKTEHELSEVSRVINKRRNFESHSTVWDKVISICNLSKEDTGSVGRVSSNLLASTSFAVSKLVVGNLLGHFYEIVKTFAASIKNSHKGETYYVGVNGPYKSITVTKICSTQDSFDRSHYCVISKFHTKDEAEKVAWKKHHESSKTSRSHFRTLDHNQVAYYLRLPYLFLSLLTWDIESNLNAGRVNTKDLPEKITASALHCIVNRDVFSQAAQQVRYFYMAGIGFGADPSKIVDKMSFFFS